MGCADGHEAARRITSVMREVAATGRLSRKIPSSRVLGGRRRAAAGVDLQRAHRLHCALREGGRAARAPLLLGRLSSVIAHEIRNPLMIIKSAARTLRQSEAGADAAERRIQDIDQDGRAPQPDRERSARLREAHHVHVARRGSPNDASAARRQVCPGRRAGVPIRAALAPGLATSPDDAERLRTVLVNLLQNAVQAVRAGRTPSEDLARAAGAPIEIRTMARDAGGVIVVVHDEGSVLTPPRRGGCSNRSSRRAAAGRGSDWAIARNIVDASRYNSRLRGTPSGTDVRITLRGRRRTAGLATGAHDTGEGRHGSHRTILNCGRRGEHPATSLARALRRRTAHDVAEASAGARRSASSRACVRRGRARQHHADLTGLDLIRDLAQQRRGRAARRWC